MIYLPYNAANFLLIDGVFMAVHNEKKSVEKFTCCYRECKTKSWRDNVTVKIISMSYKQKKLPLIELSKSILFK